VRPGLLPVLPNPRPKTAPPSFHVLTKPTGAVCNLDCTYCFFLSRKHRDDPYGEPGHNYLCAGFKRFFGHVTEPMRQMREFYLSGRPAAEIMHVYAAADAARGRDDPCSCRNGRKFKRCHGEAPLPSRSQLDAAIAAIGS
jgi:hypothetical protein